MLMSKRVCGSEEIANNINDSRFLLIAIATDLAI